MRSLRKYGKGPAQAVSCRGPKPGRQARTTVAGRGESLAPRDDVRWVHESIPRGEEGIGWPLPSEPDVASLVG